MSHFFLSLKLSSQIHNHTIKSLILWKSCLLFSIEKNCSEICPIHNVSTAWKVSVFGVFRIRISPYSVRIFSTYSVQMRENRGQRKSEYGHFSRSDHFWDRCVTITIWYEKQDANLHYVVNRKPIRHGFHTVVKPIRYRVNI